MQRRNAEAGQLQDLAAAETGINIPKLCASDNLDAFGSCRLCLIQVEGRRGYPASCTTPVEDGMVVWTETPKLRDLRRMREWERRRG